MKIFFNSSMPRSGSTLLQNILGNNPDIYATPTSGLIEMLNASKKVYSTSAIFKAQDENEMKRAFLYYCRYAMRGYFSGLTEKEYVIDKSRGWAVNSSFIQSFYPNPKIICIVRDLRDIIASMENNFRKYPYKWDASASEEPKGVTVGQRVSIWMQSNPVGNTLLNLKETINRGYDKDMLFIKFEDLTSNPEKEMKRVYKYLELPYFKADYTNIQQVTFEDDKFHGRYGDHKIHSNIQPVKSKAIQLLGSTICNQLKDNNKWYFDYFNF